VSRLVHAAVGVVAIATTAVAWQQVDRISDGWLWALLGSSCAVGVGLVALVQRRERLAGAALVIVSLTMPTGFGYVLNLALLIVSLPLALGSTPPAHHRGQTPVTNARSDQGHHGGWRALAALKAVWGALTLIAAVWALVSGDALATISSVLWIVFCYWICVGALRRASPGEQPDV
jgi:hypothetical protein